jgi:hypothetical protein
MSSLVEVAHRALLGKYWCVDSFARSVNKMWCDELCRNRSAGPCKRRVARRLRHSMPHHRRCPTAPVPPENAALDVNSLVAGRRKARNNHAWPGTPPLPPATDRQPVSGHLMDNPCCPRYSAGGRGPSPTVTAPLTATRTS